MPREGPRLVNVFGGIYRGRRVLLTGHTGFKGAWLALWLRELGAQVTGYALAPPTVPSLFEAARVADTLVHIEADIRDAPRLQQAVADTRPDIVFHLAAQSLVQVGYEEPLRTLDTNVMGTAHVLEAVRSNTSAAKPCAVVVITSDKCYENREWIHGYRETDPVGGHDPYSVSKGAAELVVAAWRRSYFQTGRIGVHGVRLASARAGNVLGGGDWARDRIMPDCLRALYAGRPISVRSPSAARPWQHVLEPLSGYLDLGAKLLDSDARSAARFADAWNFGPHPESVWTVGQLVKELIALWGSGGWEDCSNPNAPYEAKLIALSSDKAFHQLGWAPTWDVHRALVNTVKWSKAHADGGRDMQALTVGQIDDYVSDAAAVGLRWALPAAPRTGMPE